MANDDSNGFLWVLAIGATIWAWSNHEKLKQERTERIDAVQVAYSDVSKMDLRIADLERKIKFTEGDLARTAKAHDNLVDTFNNNVRIENEEAIKRMTARGACGTETVYPETGGVVIRNRQCTKADLRK